MAEQCWGEGASHEWCDLDLPYAPEACAQALQVLRDVFGVTAQVEDSLVQDLLIVAGELVVNAVEHGRPGAGGTIGLSWSVEDERVLLRVTDSGYDPQFVDGTLAPADPESLRGRGLLMVDAICEDWCVHRDAEARTTQVIARCARATRAA